MPKTVHKSRITVHRHDDFFTESLVVHDCPECGVIFAITADYNERRKADGALFRCPNGHQMGYDGDDERKRRELEEKLRQEKANAEFWRKQNRISQGRAEHEARSAAAYKGHLTRMRNRVANGVCPKGGCKRSFTNLADHVRCEHPELLEALADHHHDDSPTG
jgi:predicted RNA-binding Zn-ribbon protein involved in translation (DUF1610 family)